MNINDNDIEKYIDADLEKVIIVFDKYLENQFNVKNRNRCMINTIKMIPELIQRIIILKKEANYLAGCIEWCPDDVPMGACYDICSDNGDEFVPKEKCVQCWRERAQKAVEKK